MGSEFMTVLVDGEVEDVSLLSTGAPVRFKRGPEGRLTFIELPDQPPDNPVTIFKVRFKTPPRHMPLEKNGHWLDSDL